MENIIEVLKASDDLSAGKGASAEQIDAASKSLGLAFAEDYLMYLEEFGLAYVNGHELTGIGVIPRNDVVSVTLEKRKLPHVEEIPADWYVIEDTNIDSTAIATIHLSLRELIFHERRYEKQRKSLKHIGKIRKPRQKNTGNEREQKKASCRLQQRIRLQMTMG